MKRGWLVAILTVLVVACTDTGGEDQDTVKIALEAPITGEQASNGRRHAERRAARRG